MFVPMLCSKSKQIIDNNNSSSSRSLYLKLQKSPHTETKNKAGSNWSFASMVDYGKVTREIHQQKREQSKDREKASCTFSPLLIANRSPKDNVNIDRGVYMY